MTLSLIAGGRMENLSTSDIVVGCVVGACVGLALSLTVAMAYQSGYMQCVMDATEKTLKTRTRPGKPLDIDGDLDQNTPAD